ncbi:hypothetical protein [Xenorhabdus vietnamensis]|uniref:hypothetical protein n=1 Tax=Xenorhabdus vietnamensis TaxID=351656 RepID=UPI000A3240CF|nr:hypothetical protein [Xenorhabdus vietnamensis]
MKSHRNGAELLPPHPPTTSIEYPAQNGEGKAGNYRARGSKLLIHNTNSLLTGGMICIFFNDRID